MDDETRTGAFVGFMGLLVCLIFSGISCTEGKDELRREAAKAGAAHYATDSNGRSEFTWGPAPQSPEKK